MLASFGLASRLQAIQQPVLRTDNPTPVAMNKVKSVNNKIDIDSGFLLPESIAFLIANAVQQQIEQSPHEVTNINNNINIYGQIAIGTEQRDTANTVRESKSIKKIPSAQTKAKSTLPVS
jgi:hypothetical protein